MYSNNRFLNNQIANGTIPAYTAVKNDPSNDNTIVVGTLNCRAIGISPDYSTLTGVGLNVQTLGAGQLILGTGGCTRGDTLISDASGHGIAVDNQSESVYSILGIAVHSGLAGDIIPIQITIYDSTTGTTESSSSSSSSSKSSSSSSSSSSSKSSSSSRSSSSSSSSAA